MESTNNKPGEGESPGDKANQHNNFVITQVVRYMKYGLNVIPCWPRTKNPSIKEWKTYQNRFATEEEITDWFSHGERNLAIITGRISNIFALDTDIKKYLEAEEFLNGKHLPDTLKNHTHNGL